MRMNKTKYRSKGNLLRHFLTSREKQFCNVSSVFFLIAFNRFYFSLKNIFENCFARFNFRFLQKLTRLCTHEVEVEEEGARWVCKKVCCLLVSVAPHTKPLPAQFTLKGLPQIHQGVSRTHRAVPSTDPPNHPPTHPTIRLLCCGVLSYVVPAHETRTNICELLHQLA